MRRGLVAAVALSAGLAVVLSACSSSKNSSSSGGSGGGGGGNTTLKLVAADYGTGPSNTSQKYWEGIASDFHAANPNITVNVQTINWNDFDNQVKTQVQNKQYPDILEGDYFPDYAQSGLLYPAKDVTSPSTFSNLLPVFAKLNTYNGTQYGMPFTTSARTLFYNKKLFQQAGISSAPQTWADIQTDAAKIKALGKVGFGLPLGPEEAQAESLLWFLGNGGAYQDDSGKWVINSSAERRHAAVPDRLGEVRCHRAQPGHQEPHRPMEAVRTGRYRDDQRIAGPDPDHPGGRQADRTPTGPRCRSPASRARWTRPSVSVTTSRCSRRTAASRQRSRSSWTSSTRTSTKSSSTRNTTCFRRRTRRIKALSSDPTFGPFLKALPNSVQYPNDPVWTQVKTQIQQTIATALTQDPKKVLDSIQQTATKGS